MTPMHLLLLNIGCFGVVLTLAGCFTPTSTAAEDWTEGRGQGATRQEAIERANEDAIRRRFGEMMARSVEMRNQQVTYVEVQSHLKGGIRRYHVVRESKEGEFAIAIVRAQVVEEAVRDAARWVIHQVGRPRMLIISRENLPDGVDPGEVQTALVKQLSVRGFPSALDEAQLEQLRVEQPEMVQAAFRGDYGRLALVAFNKKADVIVRAESKCTGIPRPGESGRAGVLVSYQSTVRLAAVNVHTARTLGGSSGAYTVADINPATGCRLSLLKAAERAVSEADPADPGLLTQILTSWSRGNELVLRIDGIRFSDAQLFVTLLRERNRNVKSIEISASAAERTELSVLYSGSSTSFLQRVMPSIADVFVVEGEPVIRPGVFYFRKIRRIR